MWGQNNRKGGASVPRKTKGLQCRSGKKPTPEKKSLLVPTTQTMGGGRKKKEERGSIDHRFSRTQENRKKLRLASAVPSYVQLGGEGSR